MNANLHNYGTFHRPTNAAKGVGLEAGKRRRAALLEFLADYTARHGMPPSIREMCAATGLTSTSTVKSHLRWLVREGHVLHRPRSPRSYRLASPPAPVLPEWVTALSKSLADIHHLLDGVTANTVSNRTLTCVRALAAEGGAVLQAQFAKETT